MENMTNLHLSIFSGAGGLDIGLEMAGWDTLACIENNKDCQNTLRHNMPNSTIYSDVTSFDIAYFHRWCKLRGIKDVELISGGPPCQPFSTAGKRLGLSDDRGKLFFNYAHIIKELNPQFFIMENVRGLLSAALPNDRPGSVLKSVIYPTFQMMGYELAAGLLNARNYCVAQNRVRFIMIGSREHQLGCWPEIMPIGQLIKPTDSELKLSDVLTELDDMPEYIPYSANQSKIFKLVPPGGNWRSFEDEDFKRQIMGGAYQSTGGRVGFWRRLSYDKYSPTLTTSPIQKATGFCHPEEVRPLSVQEYARIQGFPDHWSFSGTTTSKYRQIGNAVPIQLGKSIGTALLEYFRL